MRYGSERTSDDGAGRRSGLRARLSGPAGVVMVMALVAGFVSGFWFEARTTPYGSRSFLFGGRGLDEGAAGSIVLAAAGDGGASLQVVAASGGDVRVLDDEIAPGSLVASRDGTRVAYLARPGQGDTVVRTSTVSDGATVDPAPAPGSLDPYDRPAWSSDGSRVAFVAQMDGDPLESVYVVPAAGGPPQRLGPDPVGQVLCDATPEEMELFGEPRCRTGLTGGAYAVTWLGNDAVAYISTVGGTDVVGHVEGDPEETPDRWRVHRVAATGGGSELLVETEDPLSYLVASPDGRYLLYGNAIGDTFVRDVVAGEVQRLGDDIAGPSWSPDGRKLVFVDGHNVISADADGGNVDNLTRIRPHIAEAGHMRGDFPAIAVWSPDRRHIAYAAGSRVYLMNTDGTGQTPIVKVDGDIQGLHWLPTP